MLEVRRTAAVLGDHAERDRGDGMSEQRPESVSTETLQDHYQVWRWRLELESSQRFVELWKEIGASNLGDIEKLVLVDVAWALASFERGYDLLIADIARAERARNHGVPAVMARLTGPYEDSLDYLIAASLWMDLGDVLVWYRAIADRLGHLKGSARQGRVLVTESEIRYQLDVLDGRMLPELSSERVRDLADNLLHHSWHPSRASGRLSIDLYWKGDDPKTVDFAQADFRSRLKALIEETIEQICVFIRDILQRHAATP
jgi:hypothetical protein